MPTYGSEICVLSKQVKKQKSKYDIIGGNRFRNEQIRRQFAMTFI